MNLMLAKPVRPEVLSDTLAAIVWPVTAHLPARAHRRRALPPPLIDADRLADLQRGLPDGVFAVLVEQCFGDIGERLGLLRQALADGDAVAVVRAAHALAGTASSYGLAAVERRMRAVMTGRHIAGDLVAVAAADAGRA